MKTIFKILAVALLTAMLLSLVASCQTNTPTTDTSTPATTPADTLPENPPSSVKLVENGQSSFKVVVPWRATSAEKTRIEKFVNSFKSKTGVELVMIDDTYELYGNNDFEVLIGNVARKESEDIAAQLRNNEYFYGVVGNKLVIIGKEDVDLEDAIQFFLRKVIDMAADKSNITLDSANNYFHKYNYPIENLVIGNTPIYNYSIVYSKTDLHAAYVTATRLANLISGFTGFEIPVIADPKDATPYEIVVGDTDRGTPSTASKDMFSVVCKEEKLYVASGFALGYEYLYNYLQKTFAKVDDESLTFENGFSYQESISASLQEGTENVLGKGGTVRAIFHNVLIHDRVNAPTALRAKYSLDVYRDYAPDIIGLQEMQYSIRKAIAPGLEGLGYVEVPYTERNSTFKVVEDPIFYNPETLTLITSGAYRFDEKLDKNKCIGWAVFEEKATGKRFIVASTHFAWLSDPEQAATLRVKHAFMTKDKLSELAARFNLPIIIGGDFNSQTVTEPYSILLGAGLRDIESFAQKTEDIGTHHQEPVFDMSNELCVSYSYPAGGNEGRNAIDHIFAYNATNVTFNTYDVITDKIALATSDHCPLLVDFTLGG